VEEHLGQLDLASEELLGKVRAIVWAIVVGADDHDLAVEASFPQCECGRIAGAAPSYDDDSSHSHLPRSWIALRSEYVLDAPPCCF
jgi:hypothetical protein